MKWFIPYVIMTIAFFVLSVRNSEKYAEIKQLQSECIRLGYGERDAEGNFKLIEPAD